MESFDGFRLATPTKIANPFLYSSGGLKTHAAISTSRCCLLNLSGLNAGNADVFFQLFEETPKNGSIPAWVIAVPKGGQFNWVPAQGGRVFGKLYFGVSTAPATYVPVTSAFWVDADGLHV